MYFQLVSIMDDVGRFLQWRKYFFIYCFPLVGIECCYDKGKLLCDHFLGDAVGANHQRKKVK